MEAKKGECSGDENRFFFPVAMLYVRVVSSFALSLSLGGQKHKMQRLEKSNSRNSNALFQRV
jgi:hypothetical protein